MPDRVHEINREADTYRLRRGSLPLRPRKGTRLYKVPIRWWEKTEPERATYLQQGGKSGNGQRNVYAFHAGYGHNVYLCASDCFLTRRGAIAEAKRRAAELKRREAADFDVWWAQHSTTILARRSTT